MAFLGIRKQFADFCKRLLRQGQLSATKCFWILCDMNVSYVLNIHYRKCVTFVLDQIYWVEFYECKDCGNEVVGAIVWHGWLGASGDL